MNIWQLFKNIKPFVKPYKWLVFITLILTIIGSLTAQVNAIVLDWTVDEVDGMVNAHTPWGGTNSFPKLCLSTNRDNKG